MSDNKELERIEKIIEKTDDKKVAKINWTNAWSKKYPVLGTYQEVVNISEYVTKIREMLTKLQEEYGYSDVDSMLVLKDILYHEWKDNKK